MPTHAWRVTAAATLAAGMLATAACSGDGDGKKTTADGTPEVKPLKWGDCEAPTAAQGGGQAPPKDWQCATLDVPLDYAKPEGETVPIALIRAKARDQKNRLGSLVFNFGGPGGSGISTLPGAAKEYEALRARYDLVSFDPRGVGGSDPVLCENDKQLDQYFNEDSSPRRRRRRRPSSRTSARTRRPARRTPPGCSPTSAPRTPPATWTASGRPWATRS